MTPPPLEIPADLFDAMVAHARAEAPNECCGLLAGLGSAVTARFPLANELASPSRYNAAARDLFAAFKAMRADGLELVALYHSHPTSPARPSRVDLEQNFYSDTPRIIISLASEPPDVKAFRLFEDRFDELPCVRSPADAASARTNTSELMNSPATKRPDLQRTLVLVKPDGVLRGLVGEILGRFERAGLRIAAMKLVKATRELVEKHYPSDDGWLGNVGSITKESFERQKLSVIDVLGTDDAIKIGRIVKGWNCDYLTMAPVLALILEGTGAVATVRRLTGKTLPSQAEPGTIRGDFAIDDSIAAVQSGRSVRNLIHASGTVEEAAYEIGLWFTPSELHDYRRSDAEVMGQ